VPGWDFIFGAHGAFYSISQKIQTDTVGQSAVTRTLEKEMPLRATTSSAFVQVRVAWENNMRPYCLPKKINQHSVSLGLRWNNIFLSWTRRRTTSSDGIVRD
jgi:hypothetical protein